MNGKEALPSRKHPRLRQYDYSNAGGYFVTICTHDRRNLLSRVVGRGLAPAVIEPTIYGKIAEQQLLQLEKRYPFLRVAQYVIMPNHIHAILIFDNTTEEAYCPSLMDVICAYKSLTVRECKKVHPIEKLFQTAFYEHVIRGREDYLEIAQYIENNPQNWQMDKLYEKDETL